MGSRTAQRVLTAVAIAGLIAAPSGATAAPASVQVEFAVSAGRGVWQPTGGPLTGTLVLRDVSPRMTMLAVAPRRRVVVLPSGFLRGYWARLFPRSTAPATRGARVTNGLIAFSMGGKRRLVPAQIQLSGGGPARLALRIRPLASAGHPPESFGSARRAITDVTLMVDPSITSAIRALWSQLLGYLFPPGIAPPVDPIGQGPPIGTPFLQDYYPGQADDGTRQIVNRSDWDQISEANWAEASAPGSAGLSASGPVFNAPLIDRLAVFPLDPGDRTTFPYPTVTFDGSAGRVEVTNAAVWNVQARFTVTSADFGGVNMQGTEFTAGTSISDSVMRKIDLGGARFTGSDASRVRIQGSALSGVETKDGGVTFENTDIVTTVIEKADFSGASFEGSRVQSSSLRNVDFTEADFTGRDPSAGFQDGFQGCVLSKVVLDGAELRKVTFEGSLLGKGTTLKNATLDTVDFTGVQGLNTVDLTTVTLDGPVYGLGPYRSQLDLSEHPEFLRYQTFDGVPPAIDPATGLDIDPVTKLLIDPVTGVRLIDDGIFGVVPVDPVTGDPLTDANGQALDWSPEDGVTNRAGTPFAIDYDTGGLIGPEG